MKYLHHITFQVSEKNSPQNFELFESIYETDRPILLDFLLEDARNLAVEHYYKTHKTKSGFKYATAILISLVTTIK